MILWLLGCTPGPILVPEGWVGVGSDPWGTGTPCEDWYIEDQVVEMSTDTCPFASLEQPLLRSVRAGTLLGAVSWDLLYNDVPTQAVLGVAIDGEPVWEHRQPIPSGDGDLRIEIPIDALPAGTLILLHANNHGPNRYQWQPLRVE